MKLVNCLGEYEYYLNGLGLKGKTINTKLKALSLFNKTSLNNGDLREAGEEGFLSFLSYLKGKEYSSGTINQNLSSLRQFFVWLYKNDLTLVPVSGLIPSVKTVHKEKAIFTVAEVNHFLDSIDSSVRDRLFFELLYSSGLRCSEALNLKWKGVSIKARKLKVEQGKGSRDRYVPFSLTVSLFLKKWKKLSFSKPDSCVFPGNKDGHISYDVMCRGFNKYLKGSGIEKKGLTIHSIRHSCATHLLEAGADVRYVSELLGHNCIETTVKYTHPSQESQRKAYRMYHPRENSYFKEVDKKYMRELTKLRNKIKDREEVVRKKE